MTDPKGFTNFFAAAIGMMFCTIMGTAGAVVFGVVYAAAIQLIAVGGVIFLVLVLGAYAGAIGGPVFGVAYWIFIAQRKWSSRVRAALSTGILGALIYALIGIGFLAWEASERSHQPTKSPIGANANAAAAERREQAPYSGGVIVATPDGGKVIEQPNRTPDFGRSAKGVFTTAGVTGVAGFLYGVIFGAMFGSKHRMRRSEFENTEPQRTQSSG